MPLLRQNSAFTHLLRLQVIAIFAVAWPCPGWSQGGATRAGYDRAARATVVHETNVYLSADVNAQKVSEVSPGHEVVLTEHNGPWVKVFANTDTKDTTEDQPEFSDDDAVTPASGWIRDKGVVTPSTPNGDVVLFGAAAGMEDEASQPHAPKGAAAAAHLLYRRVAEYFPQSSLAPDAAWRSASVIASMRTARGAIAGVMVVPLVENLTPTPRPMA